LTGGYWASTLGWGRDRAIGTATTYNSYLAESTLKRRGHVVWGRVETADRFIAHHIAGVHRQGVFAIPNYTAGYARDVRLARYLETAVGAQVTTYKLPALAAPVYGSRPSAVTVFVRVRPNAH
jgi:hypothetical protein